MITQLNKTTTLKGKSGKEYVFNLYSFDDFNDLVTEITAEKAALYLFTNRYSSNGKYYHNYIYLGETGDISSRYSGHHKEACIKKHNANCIGFWWAPDNEDKRRAAETDILEANNFPCNEVNN